MNKIIEQSESDLKKSISKMSFEELNSLLRLINREMSLTQQELKRSHNLLEISKEKRNNLEVFRYEQNIRDIDLEIEKLDRKKNIVELQTQSLSVKISEIIEAPKLSNGSSVTPNTAAIPDTNDDNKICLDTKKLINNFEKMNSLSTPTGGTSLIQNKNNAYSKVPKTVSNTIISQKSMKNVIEKQEISSPEPFFAQIKLKKVGLPADAQELDQNTLPNVVSNRRDSVDKKCESPIVTQFNRNIRSPSIDFTKSSEGTPKDKFHNPNKQIQAAIKNELKDVKLKKIDINNSPLNVSVEHVNMGKFNFNNERSNSTNSSLSTPMSASKSMPFLNSIASMSVVFDETDSEPPSKPTSTEEKVTSNNGEDFNVESFLKDWDPSELLKRLYTIQRKSNEAPSSKLEAMNFSSYVDIISGSSFGKSWQRRYISISNGTLHFFKNQTSLSPADTLDLRHVNVQLAHNDSVELYDSKGLHTTLRCLKSSDCHQLLASLESGTLNISNEIIPHLYDTIEEIHSRKVLIVDLGSCSVRAGILKTESTLPGLYFPHIAAISKTSNDVVEVGFEAFSPKLMESCDIIRPLKPDTTLEDLAFVSGTVELTFSKICSYFDINARDYIIMLSLPYNVAESTRSKLADVLFLRLNFRGVSMCGESLLSLHAYGEPTGLLVDIGCRTEILPVTHGLVQTASVKRSLFGGHLIQVALSRLLSFELHSITDSLLTRLIMEEACFVAKSKEDAHSDTTSAKVNLQLYNLPSIIHSELILQGKDRCLPTEGLFNPEIYSIDTCGLPEMIRKSIQSCPMDLRKDLYQSIYLSGAATQFTGLVERLEFELKKDLPSNCEVKIHAAPDRAHFSYVGACFVASSEHFMNTVVIRSEWEDSRLSCLKKWHF